MIPINESFICQKCGFPNVKAKRTCRNHCRQCLYSVHVDGLIPGDRSSDCAGLMRPAHATVHGRKGYEIVHECIACGVRKVNKAAEDDNMETVIRLSANPFYVSGGQKTS